MALLLFCCVTVAVVVGIILAVILATRNKPQSPVLAPSCLARIIDKRTHIQGRTATRYFATFELPNGERLELDVGATEAGLLIVGDEGILTWAGPRLTSFQREILR